GCRRVLGDVRSFPPRRSSDLDRTGLAPRSRAAALGGVPRLADPVRGLAVFARSGPIAADRRGAGDSRPGMAGCPGILDRHAQRPDRKSTRLNSSHVKISYAVL